MSHYYLESSAILKLFIQEQHSQAMHEWITTSHPEARFVTSDLTRIEVLGKLQTTSDEVSQVGRELFSAWFKIPVKKTIIESAIQSMKLGLRTLDSIHHATASYLASDEVIFVSYDERLLQACRETGIPTISPGAISATNPSP